MFCNAPCSRELTPRRYILKVLPTGVCAGDHKLSLLLAWHDQANALEGNAQTVNCMPQRKLRLWAYQNGEDHEAGHADLKGALKGLGVPRALAVEEVSAASGRHLCVDASCSYAQ